MIDFNLEYYRAFYYVAQLSSMSKAAEALYLSQPAISRSIKLLEDHLKCKLFIRLPRGMQLTKEGSTLFDHVEKAFTLLISAEKTLQHMANYDAGIINISATETALYHFLLPIIENFKEKYPNIYINISGSSSPETIQMVQSGAVDLAIAVTPIGDVDDLVVTETLEFHDIFIAAPLFVKRESLNGKKLKAKDIGNYPVIAVEKGTSARRHIDAWFERQGVFFEPAYSVRTSSMVLQFVIRNLAIGILPNLIADQLLKQKEILELSMENPIPNRHILVICKEDSQLTPLTRHFLDFIFDAVAHREQ